MTTKTAQDITRAYSTYRSLPDSNQYMALNEIEDRTDLTREQIMQGIRELVYSNQEWDVIPESNQKALSEDAWREKFGGQLVDYLVKY